MALELHHLVSVPLPKWPGARNQTWKGLLPMPSSVPAVGPGRKTKGLLPTPPPLSYVDSNVQGKTEGFRKNGNFAIEALGPLIKQTEVRLFDQYLLEATNVACPRGDSHIISRYWKQRYNLFSKFDEGIKMDVEGWFSVTPEAIAEHQARRCGKNSTVVDLFAGVGGNVIQFAKTSQRVIAIDIDPMKLHYAKHNASVYGVDLSKIHFVLADSMVLGPKLRGDVVFLSPPWGGPKYLKKKTFDINTMLKPFSGEVLFDMAKKIAPKVVMFLPKNSDVNQLAEIAMSASPPWNLEIEKNYLNGKCKAITAYFSKGKL